jgi:nucleoside-diphosphate-sugar epimerase
LQTILGSGGAVGIVLANELRAYTSNIRLVSRNPQSVNPDDQLLSADLTKPEDVQKAVEGSEIVYLTVGMPYDTKVWQTSWPKLMRNVIDACKTHNSKLVFFDNIYMYDPDYLAPMTEETPIGPVSKKGAIRKNIADMILDEIEKANLRALIARSADFYGPAIENTSILTEMVFKKFYNGKKANWLGSLEYKHSFTYIPDAGKATALLGNSPDAYNQVWHLPTAENPPTGKEWVDAIAKEMGIDPRCQVVPKIVVRLLGLFVPVMKEFVEMMYQYDRNYVFDSSKFEKHFDYKPTPYPEGIKEIVEADYRRNRPRPQ